MEDALALYHSDDKDISLAIRHWSMTSGDLCLMRDGDIVDAYKSFFLHIQGDLAVDWRAHALRLAASCSAHHDILFFSFCSGASSTTSGPPSIRQPPLPKALTQHQPACREASNHVKFVAPHPWPDSMAATAIGTITSETYVASQILNDAAYRRGRPTKESKSERNALSWLFSCFRSRLTFGRFVISSWV